MERQLEGCVKFSFLFFFFGLFMVSTYGAKFCEIMVICYLLYACVDWTRGGWGRNRRKGSGLVCFFFSVIYISLYIHPATSPPPKQHTHTHIYIYIMYIHVYAYIAHNGPRSLLPIKLTQSGVARAGPGAKKKNSKPCRTPFLALGKTQMCSGPLPPFAPF